MANEKKKPEENASPAGEKIQKQKRLFKKKRAGVVLTENEVREIKAGRKKLRRDLRAAGIKKRKDFETTASSLGLLAFARKMALGFARFFDRAPAGFLHHVARDQDERTLHHQYDERSFPRGLFCLRGKRIR